MQVLPISNYTSLKKYEDPKPVENLEFRAKSLYNKPVKPNNEFNKLMLSLKNKLMKVWVLFDRI